MFGKIKCTNKIILDSLRQIQQLTAPSLFISCYRFLKIPLRRISSCKALRVSCRLSLLLPVHVPFVRASTFILLTHFIHCFLSFVLLRFIHTLGYFAYMQNGVSSPILPIHIHCADANSSKIGVMK